MTPPIPESRRSSVPMRVPKDLLPALDRMKAALSARYYGGHWSRGEAALLAVQWWLSQYENDSPPGG